MVNRIKVRNNMAEKKIELQMKPKEKRITRQIELRIVNRRILVIVLIYLVSLVSSQLLINLVSGGTSCTSKGNVGRSVYARLTRDFDSRVHYQPCNS